MNQNSSGISAYELDVRIRKLEEELENCDRCVIARCQIQANLESQHEIIVMPRKVLKVQSWNRKYSDSPTPS
jgi:hypothetical protein